MSQLTYNWADEQFRAVGLDPAEAALLVDTPGPTPAHVLNLPYRRITRPAFPFEEEIPDVRLTAAVEACIRSLASDVDHSTGCPDTLICS